MTPTKLNFQRVTKQRHVIPCVYFSIVPMSLFVLLVSLTSKIKEFHYNPYAMSFFNRLGSNRENEEINMVCDILSRVYH